MNIIERLNQTGDLIAAVEPQPVELILKHLKKNSRLPHHKGVGYYHSCIYQSLMDTFFLKRPPFTS